MSDLRAMIRLVMKDDIKKLKRALKRLDDADIDRDQLKAWKQTANARLDAIETWQAQATTKFQNLEDRVTALEGGS
jgi:hypothetical protein